MAANIASSGHVQTRNQIRNIDLILHWAWQAIHTAVADPEIEAANRIIEAHNLCFDFLTQRRVLETFRFVARELENNRMLRAYFSFVITDKITANYSLHQESFDIFVRDMEWLGDNALLAAHILTNRKADDQNSKTSNENQLSEDEFRKHIMEYSFLLLTWPFMTLMLVNPS